MSQTIGVPLEKTTKKAEDAKRALERRKELIKLFEDLAKSKSIYDEDTDVAVGRVGGHDTTEPKTSSPKKGTTKRVERHNGGATVTATGRPVVLSAGSRRPPAVFTEQRKNMTEVHSTVDSVTSTLTGLGTGLSRKGRDQMPTELADAVEESHKQYVNSLGVTTSAAEKRALMGLPAVEGVSAQEAEADWRQRVARARVAAADEGACDTQSIPDYAADPVVPRLAPEETVGSAVVHVEEALEKIKACAEGLTLVERDRDLVWWASALRTRDVKSHSVRANYHARAARMWCQRGMQQLLLESTYLNTTSKKSKDDIMKLRKQLEDLNHLYESTKERCATLTSETFELQSMIDEVGEHRMMLQQSLLAEVHERHLIPEENDDVLCAELSLLLQTTHFPPGVAEDAEKVSEWLKHNSTPLE